MKNITWTNVQSVWNCQGDKRDPLRQQGALIKYL